MENEFWVDLSSHRYDAQLGWFCAALSQSGAKITEFRMDGKTIPLEQIVFDKSHIRVVSTKENPIADAAAKISVGNRSLGIDTAIWVAAITLIGTISAALIGVSHTKSEVATPKVAATSLPADSAISPTKQLASALQQPNASASEDRSTAATGANATSTPLKEGVGPKGNLVRLRELSSDEMLTMMNANIFYNDAFRSQDSPWCVVASTGEIRLCFPEKAKCEGQAGIDPAEWRCTTVPHTLSCYFEHFEGKDSGSCFETESACRAGLVEWNKMQRQTGGLVRISNCRSVTW